MELSKTRSCRHCLGVINGHGILFCSAKCRKRAKRRRDAGLPEASFPQGAHRGRLKLGQRSQQEQAWEYIAASLGELRW